jgi:hypothetical protein
MVEDFLQHAAGNLQFSGAERQVINTGHCRYKGKKAG